MDLQIRFNNEEAKKQAAAGRNYWKLDVQRGINQLSAQNADLADGRNNRWE